MRYLSAFYLFFFICTSIDAQDFTAIDAHARSIGISKKQDVEAVVQALTVNCKTETEKVRSFYVWIADNIKYDIKTFENDDMAPEKRALWQTPQYVLKNKKAVCDGYSQLFSALCAEVDISCIRVIGTTKNSRGSVSFGSHAWNLVRADGKWGFIDVTWGSGDVDIEAKKYKEHFKEEFFFREPKLMITRHYPHDPLCQMLNHPLTFDEFKQNAPIVSAVLEKNSAAAPLDGFGSLKDSLDLVAALDSSALLFNIAKRTLVFDPLNNFGLYCMGKYYYEQGAEKNRAYMTSIEALQNSNSPYSVKWCDEQTVNLQESEKHINQSIAILKKSTRNDYGGHLVRSMRNQADRMLTFTQREIDQVKKMREKINKGVTIRAVKN